MSDPIPLSAATGSFLARVDFYREPDGTIRASLAQMPDHVIEGEETITARFFKLGDWCLRGGLDFMRQGVRFCEDHRASIANDEEETSHDG